MHAKERGRELGPGFLTSLHSPRRRRIVGNLRRQSQEHAKEWGIKIGKEGREKAAEDFKMDGALSV